MIWLYVNFKNQTNKLRLFTFSRWAHCSSKSKPLHSDWTLALASLQILTQSSMKSLFVIIWEKKFVNIYHVWPIINLTMIIALYLISPIIIMKERERKCNLLVVPSSGMDMRPLMPPQQLCPITTIFSTYFIHQFFFYN